MRSNIGKKKATIYDVAKLAKVSAATVSRVINKNYYVDPETTEKVERAILATGYYPNAIARTMRRNASFSIGLIVADLTNNHFTIIAKVIDQTIKVKGYSLVVCSSDEVKASERTYLNTLMSKKMDGLVIHTSGENDDFIADLSHQVPIVLIYRKVENDKFSGDFVGSDDFNGAYRLARHVLSYGHNRIGLINGDLSISTGRERYAGFQHALSESGVTLDPALVCCSTYHFESGEAAAKRILAAPERPTVIVALSNALAMGAMACIRERGLRIPDDISFAAFGELATPQLLFINPTGINQYPTRVGEVAADLLLKRIDDRARPSDIVYVPSHLEAGNSLRQITS